MPTGNKSDFIIIDKHFKAGYIETLAQKTNLLNGSTGGAITVKPLALPGDFAHNPFYKLLNSLISHRDTKSDAAVEPTKFTMGDIISVKLNKRIGPVAQTLDAWRKLGEDPEIMSYEFGVAAANAVSVNMMNCGLIALDAAISSVAGLVHDISELAPGTLDDTAIVETTYLLGDAQKDIVCYVGHSHHAKSLILNRIDNKIVNVADAAIYGADATGLGRPLYVTDSPALVKAGGKYVLIGLTAGALEIIESESPIIETQKVLLSENIKHIAQGEYAYNVGVKGFKFNVAEENPNDATLGTAGNWTKEATDIKHCAGVRLLSL